MSTNPSIPKGTRDFLPLQMEKRKHIFGVIEKVFRKYGFLPMETPAMEQLSVLTGKYGDEGDQLMFRVLNSGNFLDGVTPEDIQTGAKKVSPKIAEKALRYDLTIPFARAVVMHQNEITFPFRRYQMQPVWRADRPQKGRYREFWQCDADVVGTDSLICEAELICVYYDVFKELGLDVLIQLNNRKILQGIADVIGIPDKLIELSVIIDKFDKIGIEGLIKEFQKIGLTEIQIKNLNDFISNIFSKKFIDNKSVLEYLEVYLKSSEAGMKGINEIHEILKYVNDINPKTGEIISLQILLARGLNYYTGAIVEVVSSYSVYGSLGGGGRYADLTGMFGLNNISGVGISFGVDRIYDVLELNNLFGEIHVTPVKIMVARFSESTLNASLKLLAELRKSNIASEIYPDEKKLGKQFEYADKKKIEWVALIGEEEMKAGKIKLKNLKSKTEELLDASEIIERVKHQE